MRIAVISSPRSGNTWLRHMLASTYGLEQRPIYNHFELDWDNLPARCAMMTHWHPSEPLVHLLDRHRFHVVTLVRHPLDMLLSILHYAAHHPGTALWLGGENGDERSILGAWPRSAAFLEYAVGARATSLLAVSHEWSEVSGCHLVRYEDLVADTFTALSRLASAIGEEIRTPIVDVIDGHTLPRMREREGVHHWQGRPGLWRELLPKKEARRIAAAHEELFRGHRYAVDPDTRLTPRQADERWEALVVRQSPKSEPEVRADAPSLMPPPRVSIPALASLLARWR